MVVAVVIVALLLIGTLLPGPSISVTGINFVSSDNACGLNGATDYGFNGTAGGNLELTYSLFNNATTTCTISNITTSTAGFSITGANTPLSIPANGTQLFSFQINFPNNSYTGVLTLVLT